MYVHIGDEIDAQYEEEIKEIIELSGTPETAFSIFSDVVKNLFEWDSQDGGKTFTHAFTCMHVCLSLMSTSRLQLAIYVIFCALVKSLKILGL